MLIQGDTEAGEKVDRPAKENRSESSQENWPKQVER